MHSKVEQSIWLPLEAAHNTARKVASDPRYQPGYAAELAQQVRVKARQEA